MWNLVKGLFAGNTAHTPPGDSRERCSEKRYVSREGAAVEADSVYAAWASGDLSVMVKALDKKTNLIDRHFLLMKIVDQAYKQRKKPAMRDLCKKVAGIHLREFPHIATALRKEMGGTLPRVTTFQCYATVLTEDKEYARAIEVCQLALSFGLRDGTESGYEGRIGRIKKKAEKK